MRQWIRGSWFMMEDLVQAQIELATPDSFEVNISSVNASADHG
jgi:hypothetical protein